MKLTKLFMPLAAVALLASCSSDNLDGTPQEPAQNPGSTGNMYLSINIAQLQTRTEGDSPYTEVGKGYENKITDAIIIFTYEKEGTETIFKTYNIGGNGVNDNGDGTAYAVFEVSRADFLANIDANTGDNKEAEFKLYMIANPTTTGDDNIAGKYTSPSNIQNQFKLTEDGDTYWANNRFLMSSSEPTEVTSITTTSIAEGEHVSSDDPLDLGTVKVQRAMARFDLTRYYTDEENTIADEWTYSSSDEDSSLKNVTLTFDKVALFNQATEANIFKVTAPTTFDYTATSLSFIDTEGTNHVWTPTQEEFTRGLFNTDVTTGSYQNNGTAGTPSYDPFNTNENLDWVSLASLSEEDETIMNGSTAAGTQGHYMKWRYVMENTNYTKGAKEDLTDVVFKGNTTGVVFRAKMTFGTDGKATKPGESEDQANIYAFSNMIIGDGNELYEYISKEDPGDGLYDLIISRFNAAVDAYNTAHSDEELDFEKTGEELNTEINKMNSELVSREFSVYDYDTTNGGYFCYYVYYNRHRDNVKPTIMQNMEFATVRNNVYKLQVTGVSRLGHPGNPANDPDPEKPGDNPEKDHLWFSVDVEVLPWVVRFNDINF